MHYPKKILKKPEEKKDKKLSPLAQEPPNSRKEIM